LLGSCIIIPKNHKETFFDLDEQEWTATKSLADETKIYLDAKYKPDNKKIISAPNRKEPL